MKERKDLTIKDLERRNLIEDILDSKFKFNDDLYCWKPFKKMVDEKCCICNARLDFVDDVDISLWDNPHYGRKYSCDKCGVSFGYYWKLIPEGVYDARVNDEKIFDQYERKLKLKKINKI